MFQYEITVVKSAPDPVNRVLIDGDAIRLVNNAFAYCFKKVRSATTGSSDIELNKYVGQVSTILRALTNMDGDLTSYFAKIKKSEAETSSTLLKQLLNINHDIAANNGKKDNHHWNIFLDFVKHFENLPNN